MMLIIDADACPSLDLITSIAKKNNLKVLIYTDVNHNIITDYGKIIVVDQGFQNVDMHIVNKVKANDIVITNDYGLALLCLAKNAKVMNANGFIYSNKNIDKMMFERHIRRIERHRTKKVKGPKKRTKKDIENLEHNLNKLLSQ